MSNIINKISKLIKEEEKGVTEYEQLLSEMEESNEFDEDSMAAIEDIIEDEMNHAAWLKEMVEGSETIDEPIEESQETEE